MGESQAVSEDLESQAQKLISKMKRTQNVKPEKKWKVCVFFNVKQLISNHRWLNCLCLKKTSYGNI